MARRGFGAQEISAALTRLTELSYVDDARFALQRATVLLRDGRLGVEGAHARLLAHGLSASAARVAIDQARRELGFDAYASAKTLLQRRKLFGRPLLPKERARAERLLSTRGFDADVVERLLSERGLDPRDGGD